MKKGGTKLTAMAAMIAVGALQLPFPAAAMQNNLDWHERPVQVWDVTSQENGTVEVTDSVSMEGFLVVTDGTALTEDVLPAMPEGYTVQVTPLVREGAQPAFCDGYADDAAFYQVHYTEEYYHCVPEPDFSAYARRMMMNNTYITDVLTLQYDVTGTVVWNGGFDVYLMGYDLPVDRSSVFAAGPDYQTAQETYENWRAALDAWEVSTDTTGMTAAEIGASRAAAGIATDAEMIMYARGFVEHQNDETVTENNFDVYEYDAGFISVSVDFTPDASTLSYRTESCWQSAGDPTSDGTIDASDAAVILHSAAETAAGGTSPLSTEQQSHADLNGDGLHDANDAAYILQFAAEAGAGSELSIGEFMTRK